MLPIGYSSIVLFSVAGGMMFFQEHRAVPDLAHWFSIIFGELVVVGGIAVVAVSKHFQMQKESRSGAAQAPLRGGSGSTAAASLLAAPAAVDPLGAQVSKYNLLGGSGGGGGGRGKVASC
eukprot:SAG22_NODE_2841_length_2163_cov_1.521802_2_plen_120_part_00